MGGGARPVRWRRALRAVVLDARAVLRRHDLALLSAGTTFYAAVAIVPLLLVTTWFAGLLAGRGRMLALAEELRRALPGELGAGDVAAGLLQRGLELSPFVAVFGVVAGSVYGEGLRRAYRRLAGVEDTFVGWRGRLGVLPLLAAAPVLLLLVLWTTPLLNDLFSGGAGTGALGVYLALNVDWLVISPAIAWSYRVVAPGAPPWWVVLVGGFTTGAFVAGFLQGFVLFLSLPLDLASPFGGLGQVGGAVSVLLWLWVLHAVALVGYAGTRALARLVTTPVR